MTNRELDVLIAEKVFGAKVTFLDQTYGWRIDYEASESKCNNSISSDLGVEGYQLKKYSTDIEAAWEVIEKFNKDGGAITYSSMKNGTRGHFVTLSFIPEGTFSSRMDYVTVDEAESAAQSICLAALKALENGN